MITNLSLPQQIENRLLLLAQELGRKEDDLIQEAIVNYLEDWEDIRDAQERLSNPPQRYLTLEEVEQELDLDD